MAVRELSSSPHILPLYLRAAAPLVPGASLLPFVPGGGGEVPELELTLAGVRAEAGRAAAYARVCGFTLTRHAAGDVPARAGVPAAHGADGRRTLPARGGRASCT